VKRVKVVLGHRQANALLEAASRGLDEWRFELDDGDSVHGSEADYRKAMEAWRALYDASFRSDL
jgi:hypothetical protein